MLPKIRGTSLQEIIKNNTSTILSNIFLSSLLRKEFLTLLEGVGDDLVHRYGHNKVLLGSFMVKVVPLWMDKDVYKMLLRKNLVE